MMLSKLSPARTEFLFTLNEKMKAGALQWQLNNENSYSSVLNGARIDVDKRIINDKADYVVWVLDEDNSIIDRISQLTDGSLESPVEGYATVSDLIKDMFEFVKLQVGNGKLNAVIDQLRKL